MEEDKLLKNKKSRKIIKLKISLPKSNNKNEQANQLNLPNQNLIIMNKI